MQEKGERKNEFWLNISLFLYSFGGTLPLPNEALAEQVWKRCCKHRPLSSLFSTILRMLRIEEYIVKPLCLFILASSLWYGWLWAKETLWWLMILYVCLITFNACHGYGDALSGSHTLYLTERRLRGTGSMNFRKTSEEGGHFQSEKIRCRFFT